MKRDHVVIILIISFLEVITHFGAEAPDSHLFYDATYYFLGLHNFPDKPVGIARPLLPFLTSLILPFINDINLTYSVINSILYPLSGIFCYKLTQKIVNSPTLSLISSVMFLTSFSMVSYGASSYYMGAAIFFEFLVAFLAFKAVGKLSYAFLIGLCSGIGALAGEAALIYVAFGFMLCISQKKYINSIVYLISAILPPLLIPTVLGFSVIDFYLEMNIEYAKSLGLLTASYWFNIFRRITLLAAGLSILHLIGLLTGFLTEQNDERLKIFYLMFSLALIAWLSWVPSERRHVYIFYPAVQWMSALGVNWIAEKLSEKPVFKLISFRWWLIISILTNAVLTNVLSYEWYLEGNLRGLGPIPGLSLPTFFIIKD